MPSQSSNRERWADPTAFDPAWDKRTLAIARLIPPGARIVEFGAGRRVLETSLPKGCRYTPSDILSRGSDTLVADLNVEFPEIPADTTHAIFSGVLEYVIDIDRLARWLHDVAGNVIASYATVDLVPHPSRRERNGWLSHYTEARLVSAFDRAGYGLESSRPFGLQNIYIFNSRGL